MQARQHNWHLLGPRSYGARWSPKYSIAPSRRAGIRVRGPAGVRVVIH